MIARVPDPIPMAVDYEGDKFSDGRPRRRVTDRESLGSQLEQLRTDFRLLKDGVSDVDRLRFSWKQLMTVVGASLFIVGANYTANAPLRATVAAIQTQQELQKATTDSQTALAEERLLNLREKVTELGRATQLLQMKIDELTNKNMDTLRRVR